MDNAENSTPPQPNLHRQRLIDSLKLLKRYAKNPVQTMRELPDWDWPTLLFFFMSLAGVCGILSALVSRHILAVIPGAIIFPISSTLAAFMVTGFFYYTYAFFFHRDIELRKLFTIVIMAGVPVLALSIFSSFLIPLNLIGFLAAGLLLVVGLVENTHVDRKKVIRIVGAIYIVYLAFWIFNTIHSRSEREEFKQDAVSGAVEILEKEKNN